MCGMALQVAGLAFSAFSSFQQAQGQKEAANYQAAVARNNAQVSQWQAQDAIRRGEEEESRQRLRTAQLKGTQRVGLAASGVDISEGSAANIQADTDWMGEQDALTIRDNANRESWGYSNQGRQLESDSQAYKAKAKSINPAAAAFGTLAAGSGTLINAGQMVADKWFSYKNNNASPGVKLNNVDPWSAY